MLFFLAKTEKRHAKARRFSVFGKNDYMGVWVSKKTNYNQFVPTAPPKGGKKIEKRGWCVVDRGDGTVGTNSCFLHLSIVSIPCEYE